MHHCREQGRQPFGQLRQLRAVKVVQVRGLPGLRPDFWIQALVGDFWAMYDNLIDFHLKTWC
jgi:hypothetical protein